MHVATTTTPEMKTQHLQQIHHDVNHTQHSRTYDSNLQHYHRANMNTTKMRQPPHVHYSGFPNLGLRKFCHVAISQWIVNESMLVKHCKFCQKEG